MTAKLAICIDKAKDFGDLRPEIVYLVFRDAKAAKEGFLRVIDDSGEDYLYPAKYFVLLRGGLMHDRQAVRKVFRAIRQTAS